tara:strand:- start:774 stop:995 length:222 start_codon:yes stop_codon:yes gene_type:complete
MTMQTVKSTLIQAIGYNPLTEQLSVTMQKNAGTTYVFRGVGRKTANDFTEADSKGQYFNRNIRGRFPTTKIAS